MTFADLYLNKYSYQENLIQQNPDTDLGFIVVIPSYKEEKLIESIRSLASCTPPAKVVEVIIVINAPLGVSEPDQKINSEGIMRLKEWSELHSNHFLKIHIIDIKLPIRTAGVGLARKIGMDEAVRRFNRVGNDKGWIIGFDADSTCESNLFIELEKLISDHPKATGCSVYFEHPLNGNEYPQEIYHSIQLYELYLRYYIEGLRFCQFPFAFHTLGSSFAVSVSAYCKQGGMNKRKAGEDFYFMHKIIPLGNYYELNSTAIYPSPRVSDRVPFGTGAAIGKMISLDDLEYPTFHPESFVSLKRLFSELPGLYESKDITSFLKNFPLSLSSFLTSSNFEEAFKNADENSTSFPVFKKRFFQWMNGLMVLQYLNYAHQSFFKKIPVTEAANILMFNQQRDQYLKTIDLLTMLRKKQKRMSLEVRI